jgi:hypothetical protein
MGVGIAYVDGPRLARSLFAAADWVAAGRDEINRINVFPVPDGDTGTNFSLTLRAVADALRALGDASLPVTARTMARGAVLGAPPAPFRTFGFSDQLVWGWVLALALTLVPVPEPWRLAGANLLLVLVVLYAARGLAVVLTQAGGVAGPVAIVLGFIAVFLLPFVVGGLTLLGLADTWLDFRRRLSTPSTGGFKQ